MTNELVFLCALRLTKQSELLALAITLFGVSVVKPHEWQTKLFVSPYLALFLSPFWEGATP